jgi:hypothetical protein
LIEIIDIRAVFRFYRRLTLLRLDQRIDVVAAIAADDERDVEFLTCKLRYYGANAKEFLV